MIQLNFPAYPLKIKSEGQSKQIFDLFRKKYVELTPEEWVRQHFLHFLHHDKKFPASLIAVEMSIGVGKLKKRCDAVIYSKTGKPVMIVECKAPTVSVSQDVFDQAMRYNLTLGVKYLAITNGLSHYICEVNDSNKSLRFITDFPEYQEL